MNKKHDKDKKKEFQQLKLWLMALELRTEV